MGGLKLGLNVYRAYVSETATRRLRQRVHAGRPGLLAVKSAEDEGVEIEIVVSEVEPVGSFAGASFSEPLLQGGILVTVFGYMLVIQPWMALVSMMLFVPQLIFVPLMQRAINRRTRIRIRTMRDLSAGLIERNSHNQHEAAASAFARRTARIFDFNMQIFKWKYSMNFLMNGLYHLSIVSVFLVGGWFAVRGEATVGTIVAFASGVAQLNDPWGDLVNYFRDASSAQIKYRLIASKLEEGAAKESVEAIGG
jgi:ABC-type bacteriocin/lantibiotic exporter with double-glycine peptidase domain